MQFRAIVRLRSGIDGPFTKLLLVMKLTAVIILAACLQIQAKGYSQNVSISVTNAPLEKVFSEIEKQTGYYFTYTREQLQGTRNIDLHISNASITEVLDLCFKNQPVTYQIIDKAVIIKQADKKTAEAVPPVDPGPPVKAYGFVYNETGQPLSGANVIIKATGRGTITNAKGEFMLPSVPLNSRLIVSFVGYISQETKITEGTPVQIYLNIAKNELDKVVVQAYGTTTQRLATGNITTVTAAEIERQPVMNPLLALQGKVAGLDVIQTSGYASAPLKVELRGRKTIGVDPSHTFPSDPLYIIDGVPLTVLEIGGSSSYDNGSTGFIQNQNGFNGPAGGQSPLFSVNPADIESIEVLKDADATAIYGSRGANGVILITTKKGKPGKTQFGFNIQTGIARVTRYIKLLNTQQYLEMRHEAFRNDGTSPTSKNAYDLLSWDTTRYTDWQKALYGGTGRTIDARGAVSGGDANTTFRIGMDYNRVQNIQTVSGADQRGSVSFNITNKSISQKFSISLTGAYSFSQSNIVNLPATIDLPPNAPGIYDSVGNLNYAGWGGRDQNINARRKFPFESLKESYVSKTNFLNSSLTFNYQVMKGLNLSASIGYNNAQANQTNLIPIAAQDPINNPTGSLILGYNSNKNWIAEPQVTYERWLWKGKLNILAGSTIQQARTSGLFLNGVGYTSDDLINTITSAPQQYSTDTYGEYKYAAVFGRINYNLFNKYIINLSARRDGSSRFGRNRQYGSFGSVGAAWIFSEEGFVKNHLKFISLAKLRGSFGTTGNDAVGDYQYLTRWAAASTTTYNGLTQLVPIQHANPDFQWQRNNQFEGAIDLGFLKDRIRVSAAYYRSRTGNQLISFPLPSYTGFTSVTANSPALVENSGWEFTANFNILRFKNFQWNVNFNTSINKNKLVAYPNFSKSPFVGQLVVGKPLNIRRLLHYTGVGKETGEYSFFDKNHDGQITYDYTGLTDDDSYVYSIAPKFFGGLGMDFNYKGLQLNLFFVIKKQIGRNSSYQGNIPGRLINQPDYVLNRWQKSGDISSVARFTTGGATSDFNYKSISDGAYTDASYIRLSNLSLSYTLPASALKLAKLQACNVFFNTNNLFVITKYRGIDPETQNFNGLPPVKVMVLGLSFSF